MIILFEANEKEFKSLGLGVLTDAVACSTKEKLNGEFALQMEYPVKGKHFSKIQIDRILFCKANPYDNMQAFRIIGITKPINRKIIVSASHISYDLNNIPSNAVSGDNIQDLLTKIQNGTVIEHDFQFISEIVSAKTFKTTAPFNLRAILMGGDESIISKYDAEVKFDNFLIRLVSKRGSSRGAVVRYGHNMTDLNHETSSELLYKGVFPYYHTETQKNETTTKEEFTKAYIVGSKPLQDGWLSFSKDGLPYHPLDSTPVQIDTEGDFYQKVYSWDETYNLYKEKLYNQTVTLIQGLLEPEWINIDWSSFPNVICKASKKGYFKLATDNDWGDIKGVGDVVFERSITSSGIMENMILYYSEVIPSKSQSTNSEVSEIKDVQLDEKIILLDTADAKSMKYNKILMVDLTSEFEEEPTKDILRAKAEEFINKNKLGSIKHTTTVSFIDLSSTTEQSKYENFDHVEIGDTVKIVYEDADISIDLRVISTEYDVLTDKYISVELGEKKETMSSESVQNGDSVSSLTNDVGYATVTTVNKLIADTITANYIEALNAKLTSAQISQLEVEKINVKGIIEASQFTIDNLVAKLLIAEDAIISKTLSAGNIKVAGDISINSGKISIGSDDGTMFVVDREGNLIANSVEITGGTLNINDGMFEVTNEGILSAKAAHIEGDVIVTSGSISIGELDGTPVFYVDQSGAVTAKNLTITGGEIKLGGTDEDPFFNVDKFGAVTAKNLTIIGGKIKLGGTDEDPFFNVDKFGAVTAKKLTITGGAISLGNGMLEMTDDVINLYNGALYIDDENIVHLGNSIINNISSCETAVINSLTADNITTNTERISSYLYFGESGTIRLGTSETPTANTQNNVSFTPSLISPLDATPVMQYDLESSGNIKINIKSSATTLGDAVVTIKITYTINRRPRPGQTATYTVSRNISTIVPTGTDAYVGHTINEYFSFSSNYDSIQINSVDIIAGSPQNITYYTNPSTNLELRGSFVPSVIDGSCSLGKPTIPWSNLYLLSYRQYDDLGPDINNYIEQRFASWIKYEPSSTSPWFRIGQSSETDDINAYSDYYDESLLGLYSQGRLTLQSFGESFYGKIEITSNRSYIDLYASKYLATHMYDRWWNFNREGIFIDNLFEKDITWDPPNVTTRDLFTMVKQDGIFTQSEEELDEHGPWMMRVFEITQNPNNRAVYPMGPSVLVYAAFIGPVWPHGNDIPSGYTTTASDQYIKISDDRHTVYCYNDSALLTRKMYVFVLCLRIH